MSPMVPIPQPFSTARYVRDPDLVREVAEERRANAKQRRHRTAWDEPPDYYDDEEDAP